MFFSNIEVPLTYHLIRDPRKLSWLANELSKVDEYAFDVETNHPTAKNKKIPPNFVEAISGVSFAWGRTEVSFPWEPGTAAYVPLRRQDDSPFWGPRQEAVVAILKEMLENNASKVAQYGKFDVYKLCKLLDIKVTHFDFCTVMTHSLIDEERRISTHKLKSEGKALGMANVYLDLKASQFKEDLDSALIHYDPKYKRYSKVPLDILFPYGCSDSDFTLALKIIFKPMLEQEGLTWLFENLVMKLQHELVLMELHGVPLDLNRANQIKIDQEVLMGEYASQVYEICGQQFDVGSPTQLGKILFEHLQIPGGKRNKQGWITDAEALEKIDHAIIDPILKWRRAQKIHGSFAVPALNSVDEITNDGAVGWVHMAYFPDSLTGRLKGSDPNLTALPRPENGGDVVKSMWAGGEDYRFVFKDFSQIELRMIGHCSNEPVWIDGFKAGHDMHSAMAQRIWHPEVGISDIKKYHSDSRSKAKTVNFGIAFGKSTWTLSQDLGIPYDEADRLINEEYFGVAPVLKAWIDNTHEFARQNGYVYNIFGRRRHLPNAQIEIPEYLRWPPYNERLSCYRKGPSLELLKIDPDDMYDVDESQIKDQINLSGKNYYGKCLVCPNLRTCVVNTEVKRISGIVGQAMRQAVNSPIQGGATDMASLALVWIGEALRRHDLDASCILHIHDELCVYSHVSCVEKVDKIMDYFMTEYMEEFTNFKVPLVVDTAVCHRWSEKHEKE